MRIVRKRKEVNHAGCKTNCVSEKKKISLTDKRMRKTRFVKSLVLPLCKAANRAKLGINSRTKRNLEWDHSEREAVLKVSLITPVTDTGKKRQ